MRELTPGREGLTEIATTFVESFVNDGYALNPGKNITDKIDPTVRFIGAPISVLKPYLTGDELPQAGVCMLQPCVRTQNVMNLFEPTITPDYGSYFLGLGALTDPDRLSDMFQETSRFVARVTGADDKSVFISTSSHDEDLLHAAENNGLYDIKTDVMDQDYYRHGYGMEGVRGRNTSYWIKNKQTGEYEDIGNVILIENYAGKLGIEFAFGDSTLVKQVAGLDHVLDAYNMNVADNSLPAPIKRRLEDCIITSMALTREGLEPSARDNQTRILRSYFKGISLYRRLSELSVDSLVERVTAIEQNHLPFDAQGVGKTIGAWVIAYETKVNHSGPSNAEDEKILKVLASPKGYVDGT